MSLNESIVEDAALEWFLLRQGFGGQVGEQPRCARTLAPALGERKKDGEVLLVERLREAIRRLNPAVREEARVTIRQFRRVQIERRTDP